MKDERGTYQVCIVIKEPQDGSGADTVAVKLWPGSAPGFTPPKTWDEAFKVAARMLADCSKLPSSGINEVRITTFEQEGEDDRLGDREMEDDIPA